MWLTCAAVVLLDSWCAADVERLGSPSWKVREAAHARLKKAGSLAEWALERGVAAGDWEVKRRCELLLRFARVGRYDAWCNRLRPRGWSKMPWFNFAIAQGGGSELPNYVRWARYDYGYSNHPGEWEAWREATRLWLVDRLSRGATEGELREKLSRMVLFELRYKGETGMEVTAP